MGRVQWNLLMDTHLTQTTTYYRQLAKLYIFICYNYVPVVQVSCLKMKDFYSLKGHCPDIFA